MKTITTLLLSCCLLFSVTLPGRSRTVHRYMDDTNFNSRNRIYGYLGADIFSLTEEGLAMRANSDPRLAPFIGAGFTLVNFGHGLSFINLEADYTRADFDISFGEQRSASMLTFMLQGEIRFSRPSKISLFTGVGIGILHLGRFDGRTYGYSWEAESRSDPALAWDLGVKISLVPHLMLRAGARFFFDIENSGFDYWDDDYDYWYDDYDYWDDDSSLIHWASSVFVALEYHF